MKPSLLLSFIALLTISSCNQVNNLGPEDPGIPTKAIQVVKTHFPDANELVFTTLLPDKVWEARFTSQTRKYSSLVDRDKMWETFLHDSNSTPSLLTYLMTNTAFKGGDFSNNAEDISFFPTPQRKNRLVYRLHNEDYSLTWQRLNGLTNYRPSYAVIASFKHAIVMPSIEDLPRTIQGYISQNKELTFVRSEVRIDLKDEKQFIVTVRFNKDASPTEARLLFDQSETLQWVSREFNQPKIDSAGSNIEKLPDAIQFILDNSPKLQGFEHPSTTVDKWKGEYNGVTSYTIKLWKEDTKEQCELQFNAAGKLLEKIYRIDF